VGAVQRNGLTLPPIFVEGFMDRAEEFVQLFNKVQDFLVSLTNRPRTIAFWQLVDAAAVQNAAVRSNSARLKQFAMLRNAIVHDAEYPPQIVAMPSEEALRGFKMISKQILQPRLLIPTFAAEVLCFSPNDSLADGLRYMRSTDFSQIVIKQDDRKLRMLTVEGITKWLAKELDSYDIAASRTTLGQALALEHPSCVIFMSPKQTVYDATDAFKNSVHQETTRLYAIIVTHTGTAAGSPVGFVTPWDLVHSPRLHESFSDLGDDSLLD
jgi:hypothetical protein